MKQQVKRRQFGPRTTIAIMLAAASLVVVACGGSDTSSTDAASATTTDVSSGSASGDASSTTGSSLDDTRSDDARRADLTAEFAGAYPAEPIGGGETVEVELVAADSSVDLIDAGATPVWAYNDQVPGPALRLKLGDTLRATIRNDLDAATTIHWHGVRVPNDMDGVPGVNQPMIEPGATFVYEFTPPDAGTYWYHSHADGSQQLERGLYGSIVVEDPNDGTSYDHDQVWMVDDWLLDEDGQINPEFNTSTDRTTDGRWGNLITANTSTDERLTVAPGDRIRLRLINSSNARAYAVDFGELDPTVIAIDGLTVGASPAPAVLPLATGNRIDVDITAPDTPGEYPIVDNFEGLGNHIGTIVVEQSAGETDRVAFEVPTNPDVPDWADAVDAPIDHELVFATQLEGDDWIWTINGAAYPNYEPLKLTQGEFTKIRLINQSHPMHPIHLHGMFFKVISRNGQPVDEPYFRDTVLLQMMDTVEIALVPLDEGEWVVHCHIQEHAEAGMMTVAEVAPAA